MVFCYAASFVLCFRHSMMLHWTQMLLPLWVLCFVVLWVLCACKCGCMWCCTGRKCCDHTAHKHWTFLLQLFPLLLLRLCPSLSSSQETQIKDLIIVFFQTAMWPWPFHLPTSHNYKRGWVMVLPCKTCLENCIYLVGFLLVFFFASAWMQNHCWYKV